MKFEENEIAITIPKYQNVFIYFLLKENVVVYVGKTAHGITRPLSHKNKEYDTIKIIYCSKEELDFFEDKYITKYEPKYNKTLNEATNYTLHRARDKIRRIFNNDITIPELKKLINKSQINLYLFNKKLYIKHWDLEKLINYLKEVNNGSI